MMYDTLLARSFSKHDQKKLRYGALAACSFIALSFFIVFNPYLGPLNLNFRLSIGHDQKLLLVNDTSSSNLLIIAPRDVVTKNKTIEPLCNVMGRSDFCEIQGDIRINGNASTVTVISAETNILAAQNTSWSIRPYARKESPEAMNTVREWSVELVTDRPNILQCTENHSVPAILFSVGGYSGNYFHAFTDVILPLYSTARPFNGEVQFLVTNRKPWWIAKYTTLLKALSRYEFVDIDDRHDIHCFGSLIVGLKGRTKKELKMDPLTPYSMKDFREFLRKSYFLNKTTVAKIRDRDGKRPQLLIIPRKGSRALTNVGEIEDMAKRLGYEVVVAEPDGNVSRFAEITNSCDVVMGVHGAGLTNMVFLPENAILIQLVPFGGAEWVARVSFEEPAKDMNLRYLDYKIGLEESTLIQQYPADHVVLRDPSIIRKQGFATFRSIYFEKQNVTLDVDRFRPTLVKALELLHQ